MRCQLSNPHQEAMYTNKARRICLCIKGSKRLRPFDLPCHECRLAYVALVLRLQFLYFRELPASCVSHSTSLIDLTTGILASAASGQRFLHFLKTPKFNTVIYTT